LSTQQLKAKAAWNMARFKSENWMSARQALDIAVKLEPNDPIALAMHASMATQLIPLIPFSDLTDDPAWALTFANKAVELGHNVDYVLRTRGNIRLWLFGDHKGARRDCERALRVTPEFHLAHLTLATSEILSGSPAASVNRLEEMMRRTPFDTQNPFYISLIALGHILRGQDAEAVAAGRDRYELWPEQSWMILVFAAALGGTKADGAEARGLSLENLELSASRFRKMPFTDHEDVAHLEERFARMGLRVMG
jgi:tetratricopeptide (TPR) repeat protein